MVKSPCKALSRDYVVSSFSGLLGFIQAVFSMANMESAN